MMRGDAKLPNGTLGVLGAVAFPIAIFFLGSSGALIVMGVLAIVLTIWYVFWTRARVSDMAISMFGAIYMGLSLSAILVMRVAITGYMSVNGVTDLAAASQILTLENLQGGLFVIFLFTAISLNDGMAYLFGRKFGKHRLAPHVSPKKS